MQQNMIVFRGKKYPRRWGGDRMSLTEAMDRVGAKDYTVRDYSTNPSGRPSGFVGIILHINHSDVPEGVEYQIVTADRMCDNVSGINMPPYYTVSALDLSSMLDPSTQMYNNELKAATEDLNRKIQILADMEPLVDAATFALERSKADGEDTVSQVLHDHWAGQEHAYLIAKRDVKDAKKIVDSFPAR